MKPRQISQAGLERLEDWTQKQCEKHGIDPELVWGHYHNSALKKYLSIKEDKRKNGQS